MPYADKTRKQEYDRRRCATTEYRTANRARCAEPAYKQAKKARDVEYRKDNRERLEGQRSSWRERNAEKMDRYRRDWGLRKQYNITLEEYERRVQEQGGLCAICGCPPTGRRAVLVVDHNHETGAVRELLCANCNFAVGHLRESVEHAESLAAYLRRWR